MAQEEPPPVPWVVKDFAARQEVTQLWGRPGSMKSMLLLALAGAVAEGTDLAGLACEQGGVLYIDAENGQGEVHRRVRNLDLPPNGVEIFGASGAHLVTDEQEIEQVISRLRPALVVFDSLRRLLPGTDENDSEAMAAAVGGVQRLAKLHNFAGVIIHHGAKHGNAYRGSSAIEAEVSISFKLAREKADPLRRRRYLECEKCRVADEPERRWFNLGTEFKKIFIEAAAPFEGEDTAPAQTALSMRVMALFDNDGSLRLHEIAKALDENPKSGTLRRVLDALESHGDLNRASDKSYSRVPGASALSATDPAPLPQKPDPFIRQHP